MNPRFDASFSQTGAMNTHHNGQIMASRIFALITWAAVAASLAYWGLRWLAHPAAVPPHANRVSLDSDVRGDFQRLLAGPAKAASSVEPNAASQLAGRIRLIGAVAPRGSDQSGGVALISVDGKPPRAVRVGGAVDGDLVLQSVSQRQAQIGRPDASPSVTLTLPSLPMAATGTLPAPTGVTRNAGAPTYAQAGPMGGVMPSAQAGGGMPPPPMRPAGNTNRD